MQSTTPGTLPEVSFVSRSTLEKRVRRALATKGYRLLKSRPGTPAFREYGLYAVENGLRRIIAKHQDIDSLARELGVMATHERLRPRYERISTATHEGTDRMTYFVIGEPGTGKMPFDLLAGPFDELALAKESAAMMEGQGHV